MQSHSMLHIRVDVQRVPGVRDRQFYKHGKEMGKAGPRGVLASKLRRIRTPNLL